MSPSHSLLKPHERKHKKDSKRSVKTSSGPWSKAEDKILLEIVNNNGARQWSERSVQLRSRGVFRNSKQCRERFINHLSPEVVKTPWTVEEDLEILRLQRIHGNKWSKISRCMLGRSDNHIKNRWNTRLGKGQCDLAFLLDAEGGVPKRAKSHKLLAGKKKRIVSQKFTPSETSEDEYSINHEQVDEEDSLSTIDSAVATSTSTSNPPSPDLNCTVFPLPHVVHPNPVTTMSSFSALQTPGGPIFAPSMSCNQPASVNHRTASIDPIEISYSSHATSYPFQTPVQAPYYSSPPTSNHQFSIINTPHHQYLQHSPSPAFCTSTSMVGLTTTSPFYPQLEYFNVQPNITHYYPASESLSQTLTSPEAAVMMPSYSTNSAATRTTRGSISSDGPRTGYESFGSHFPEYIEGDGFISPEI